MARREVPYLRLVTNEPQVTSSTPQPRQRELYDNTMVREFRGPFAQLGASLAFEYLVDWGTWQLVSWTRFSWRSPRTWFYARIEAVNTLSIRDWNRLENITQEVMGRKWQLHHAHRA